MLNKHPNLLCQLVCIGFYMKDPASINLYFISIVDALDETYHSRCSHFLMQNTEQSSDQTHALFRLTLSSANDWFCLSVGAT